MLKIIIGDGIKFVSKVNAPDPWALIPQNTDDSTGSAASYEEHYCGSQRLWVDEFLLVCYKYAISVIYQVWNTCMYLTL